MIAELMSKVRGGKTAIGHHICGIDPEHTEMIASIGYDYLWIDMEHTSIDKRLLPLHLMAAKAYNVPCFVRIPWNDLVLAKPILEMGIDGMIFPLIQTADDARRAVSYCLYPPEGLRGFGPRRAVRYGLDSVPEYISAKSKELLKLIQIETRSAYDHLEEIAAVEGVDVLILGPADLSGAFGKLCRFDDPEIQQVYKNVVQRSHAAGKPVLVSTGAYSRETIRQWRDLGCDMITIGTEAGYVVDGASAAYAHARDLLA